MEKLEPFEKLVDDYYLGERNGWYSDGERGSSESSGDELKEAIEKLAGTRSCRKSNVRERDEFESDMDDNLDKQMAAHTSAFMSPTKGSRECETQQSDLPAATTMELDQPSTSVSAKTKKVKFIDSNNDDCDSNNSSMKQRKEEVPFYDSDEDDDNEKWVREHRERLKLVKPEIGDNGTNKVKQASATNDQVHDSETDAVLSCPACMTLLTRDCQRHDLYRNQYRAIFVENCKVLKDELLYLPKRKQKKRRSKKEECGIPKETNLNTTVSASEVSKYSREDLFHPVQCGVCSTTVGVYDCEELFHFFNVLSGYS
ncbi:hypothetical protein AB6A40_011338 [Gnathostoma spinigerum]|uniref:E2F-associated phosphoprotein n=1 Tax=Gnathostoma spinigerum TaxID=75299 RepID=A0ABD6EXD0_9BILA